MTSVPTVTDDASVAAEALAAEAPALAAAPAGPDADGDGMPDAWEDFFGLNKNNPADAAGDLDGDGRTNLQEYQANSHPNGKAHRYFAEGATGFFNTSIGLFNPSPTTTAKVLLSFVTEQGTLYTKQVSLDPRHRTTVSVNTSLPGVISGVSTHVESDIPVAADRFMRWGPTSYGSSLDSGVDAPATTWYFSEGATGQFALYYLILNPGDTPANVSISYLSEFGAPIVKNHTVAAHRRETVFVNTESISLLVAAVGAAVTSNVPVVVERSMYKSSLLELFGSGGASSGASTLSKKWYFAEGATGPFFDEYILLANPSGTPADAEVTFRRENGTAYVKHYTVQPQTRRTIWINQEAQTTPALAALATGSVSVAVNADQPIVAERSMWWQRGSDWYENHVSLGTPAPGPSWMIAEAGFGGSTSDQTFILISNTAAASGTVKVTSFKDDGTSAFVNVAMTPNSRKTLEVGPTFGLSNSRVSLLVESQGASPLPIVVDYVRYSTTGFRTWNAGGAASAIPYVVPVVETAPTVTSTTPANGATNVSRSANLSVTFSEPVNVTASAFTLECPAGTPITLSNLTASPATTFTLDPSVTLPATTACKLVIHANQVTDADAIDPPDQMASDVTVNFTTAGCPTITVTPNTLTAGNVGVAYGPVQFAQSGSSATPITWSVSSGTLPPGMSVNATGQLTGTPTTAGSYTFTVQATDADGCSGSVTVTLSVTCPTITVAPSSLLPGNVGVAYGPVQFTQTGAPTAVTWSLSSGTLPAGMAFSAAGVLSGTPTVAGSFTFTVLATDANGCTGSVTVTLNVSCPTITVSPNTLTNATAGTAYGPVTFTQTGSPTAVTFSVSSGTLPTGMTLSPAGALSGTPTSPGSFTFTVTATDANGCTGSVTVSLQVDCPVITVSPSSLTNATAGSVYGPVTFTQTGGVGTTTFAVTGGALPTGLTLTSGGVLSGTPTVVGSFTFTVTATDSNGCTGTVTVTLQVQCPVITVTPTTLTNATVGSAYGPVTFSHTGGVGTITYSVTSGTLPAGLTLSAAGVLSGTPTAAGSSTFTVTATDANGCTGTVTVTLTVVCPPITVTPASLTDALGGVAYSQLFTVSGGTAPHTWSMTGSVPGLAFNTGTHTLSGTPTQPGIFPLTITATDTYGCSGSSTPTLTVQANAVNDVFAGNVLGNVSVSSGAFSVLTNDVMGTSPVPTVTAFDATSANGGTVSVAPNGTFTYDPPAGFEGTDTFNYTATAGAFSDSATVSITVSGMIWFIDGSASCAPCDGRLSRPFKTLAAFTALNDGIDNVPGHSFHPANNDNIFIAQGADYTGPIALRAGQKLIGQDATATLATIAGVTPHVGNVALPTMNAADGTFTRITGTGSAVIALGNGNVIRGLRVLTGAGGTAGISGNGFGTVTISDASVAGTGPAVSLQNGAVTAMFSSLSSTGSTSNGILLNNTTGSFSVTGDGGGSNNGSGGTITSSAAHAVQLTNATSVNLGYMNITSTFTTGDGVNIQEPKGTWTLHRLNLTNSHHNNATFVMTSGTLTGFTMTNTLLSGAVNNSNMDIAVNNTAVVNSFSLTNNTFQNAFADGLQIDGSGTSTITDALVQGNTFNGNNLAMDLDHNFSANVTYRVLNNTITNHQSHSMNVFSSTTSAAAGVFKVRIQGNAIGTAGDFDSGSAIGNAMRINLNGDAQAIVAVDSNTIREVPTARAIEIIRRLTASGAAKTAEITVTGNTVFAPTGTAGAACGSAGLLCPLANYYVAADTSPSAVNLNIANNTGYNPGSVGVGGESTIRVREVSTGITQVQGSGSASTQVSTNNPAAATVSVDAGVSTYPGPVITPP